MLAVLRVVVVVYDNKVKGTYRLCVVIDTTPLKDNIVVRTVKVGFRSRRHFDPGLYKNMRLYEMDVAVQRLVLLVTKEDAGEVVPLVPPMRRFLRRAEFAGNLILRSCLVINPFPDCESPDSELLRSQPSPLQVLL